MKVMSKIAARPRRNEKSTQFWKVLRSSALREIAATTRKKPHFLIHAEASEIVAKVKTENVNPQKLTFQRLDQ